MPIQNKLSHTIARIMDEYLCSNRGVFISIKDIINECLRYDEFKKIVERAKVEKYENGNYIYAKREDYEILSDKCKDVIKKAKSKLRKGLACYGLDFETEGSGTGRGGTKFRYPLNTDIKSFFEVSERVESVDKRSLESKYSKVVKGKIKDCIRNSKVIEFDFFPQFDKSHPASRIELHPHYLKEYNGRVYVFGYSKQRFFNDKENMKQLVLPVGNFPLDRIDENSVCINERISFINPTVDFSTFFDDIVGVTHLMDNETGKYLYECEEITIRTLTPYAHGRLVSKPIHQSQIEVREFEDGYGEITIKVRYNYELLGALFAYEGGIEVVSPKSIRDKVTAEVQKMNQLYKN